MKTQKQYTFDREYLRRCKYASPEQKLEWLAAAVELVKAAGSFPQKRDHHLFTHGSDSVDMK